MSTSFKLPSNTSDDHYTSFCTLNRTLCQATTSSSSSSSSAATNGTSPFSIISQSSN
ncbi:unnamed protein product, partial [Rotaria magnacalcarata]